MFSLFVSFYSYCVVHLIYHILQKRKSILKLDLNGIGDV
jgi:hypothetical protein